MKNIFSAILIALVLIGVSAPARAGDRGDKVAAAVGGFIGGVIVGSHIERGHDHHRHHPMPGYHPRIIVSPRHVSHHGPSGHWEDITTSVWVSARWILTVDSCGREVRHYENGYYEYRTERVWVDYRFGPSYRRR